MKKKRYYLLPALIILFGLSNLCLAQKNGDADANLEVVAKSTFITFDDVKNNFGKKFAQSYFVVQVEIHNDKLNKQFIVQTIDVVIDPNQCRYAQQADESFPRDDCKAKFDQYFYIINPLQAIRREEVIATGKADLNRSNRNVGFRVLAFTATMGTILTGFKGLIGRDGILGINVLGTTVSAAANTLFPNIADEKLENLRNAIPTENIIIPSKQSKKFNIFIPTERVFWKDSWKKYIKITKDSSYDTFKLKILLDLIMLSSATGVLVDNDAPKVQVRSDDSLRRQAEKLLTINAFTEDENTRARNAFDTRERLNVELDTPGTASEALKKLRKIVDALRNESQFRLFFDAKTVTNQSDGKKIVGALRELLKILRADNKNDNSDSIKKYENIVIQIGN